MCSTSSSSSSSSSSSDGGQKGVFNQPSSSSSSSFSHYRCFLRAFCRKTTAPTTLVVVVNDPPMTTRNDHLERDVDLSKYSSTNWQSDASYRKIAPKSLVFPGTHDSGSYFLTSHSNRESRGRYQTGSNRSKIIENSWYSDRRARREMGQNAKTNGV